MPSPETTIDYVRDEASLAAALDALLDAANAGVPIDREALLSRHPSLIDALGALAMLAPPPAARALPPRPDRIGPYAVERELGAGGFGVVYLAFDPDVRRRVAIKVLHPGRLDQPEAVNRFRREAHATGRLQHPGIVRLFDYSRDGPPYYLITEYIEGVEPRVFCRAKKCDAAQVTELVARIADAVGYAHAQGVCHRDLKPGNILIDGDGVPHVLDFGLARFVSDGSATLTSPTGEGHILGSLAYMPPEQASGRSHTADSRSDVYSLGVILYELLTGRLPFQGPAHALPSRVVEESVPSPRKLNRLLSRDLEAVVLKALSRHPGERYADAAELAVDLRAAAAGLPVKARHLSGLRYVLQALERRHLEMMHRGWPALLLLLGVTILAGCVVSNVWQRTLAGVAAWAAVSATKVVQVGVMLLLVRFVRPRQLGSRVGAEPEPELSAAERQIWSLMPGYYGSFATLMYINLFLEHPIPPAPVLALLSGMGYCTLGASIWGWFYVWGGAFFLLAGVIAYCEPVGMTLLGLGWFVCLAWGAVHLWMSR